MMNNRQVFPLPTLLHAILTAALLSLSLSQSWDYTYREYIEEEVPVFKIVKETLSNGYYDHGNGMTMKSVIFELGGCSKGHPCAISTGLSHLYPDGCPATCVDRWIGDPFRSYDQQCADTITAGNSVFLEEHHGNLTQLVTEWFEYFDPSCMLNYDYFGDEWVHEAEGVAIVTRAQGFTFAPQTVIVSDIDSADASQTSPWPDVVQEASTNFAMIGNQVLRPTNTYARDKHSFLEVLESGEYVTEINVTLSQMLLDALQLPATSTWMPVTISALTSDKVGMLPSWIYPEFAKQVMGGMVWAHFSSPFDTLVQTMTLGRKQFSDHDQGIELHPLKVRTRCRCGSSTQVSLIVRPTANAVMCTSHLISTMDYMCDDEGPYYCNLVRMTGWHRTTAVRQDGTVGCEARNQTKTVFEMAVGEVGAVDWSWPTGVGSVAFPSNSPGAAVSASLTK